MALDTQKDDFNALLELVKSFPEVGKIVIATNVDGSSSCSFVTENEWPLGLQKEVQKRFPDWTTSTIGPLIIDKKSGMPRHELTPCH